MPKSLVYIDNKEYYVVENTDNNFFSVTKISSNGKKLSQKSFSGTVTNIKKINKNELILIGGSPAFIIKINKDDLKEEQKVLEDNSSIFNDFIVTKDYFLMVGEDYITKESLMIKYDKTLKKLKVIQEKEDIKIIHSRAEIASHDEKYRENFDLVVSRAVSSIENVIEYSSGFVKIGEHAILMRGKKEEYNKKYLEKFGFKEIIHESYKLFDEDRSIIILKKVKKLDSKLPSKTPKQKS